MELLIEIQSHLQSELADPHLHIYSKYRLILDIKYLLQHSKMQMIFIISKASINHFVPFLYQLHKHRVSKHIEHLPMSSGHEYHCPMEFGYLKVYFKLKQSNKISSIPLLGNVTNASVLLTHKPHGN